MSNTSMGLSHLDPDEVVRRGQEAWSQLRTDRSYGDWLAVGEAIQVGRHRTMIEAHTNQPRGSRFNTIFGDWLKATGFDTLDASDRKRLLDILAERAEIDAWRLTLPLNKRLRLNHPRSIWRHWQATKMPAANNPERLSPGGKLKQEIARLEEENHQLRGAADDLFSPRDTVADITRLLADRLLQRLTPIKARQIVEALPSVFAERAELEREAMTPKSKKRRTPEEFRRDVVNRWG